MASIKKFRRGVFIVVYRVNPKKENNNIEYLLLKRKLHWIGWEFPKGGIKKGESELNAVKRELREETHLKIKKIKNHHFRGRYNYQKLIADRKYIVGQTYSLYSAEVYFGKARIDKHEHSACKWLGFKQALKKLTYKEKKKCLKIVNRFLGDRKD